MQPDPIRVNPAPAPGASLQRGYRVLGCLLGVLIGLCLVLAQVSALERVEARKGWVQISAMVRGTSEQGGFLYGRKPVTVNVPQCDFTFAGQRVVGKPLLPDQFARSQINLLGSLQVGDDITVRVNPANPSEFLAFEDSTRVIYLSLGFGVLMVLVSLSLLIFSRKS